MFRLRFPSADLDFLFFLHKIQRQEKEKQTNTKLPREMKTHCDVNFNSTHHSVSLLVLMVDSQPKSIELHQATHDECEIHVVAEAPTGNLFFLTFHDYCLNDKATLPDLSFITVSNYQRPKSQARDMWTILSLLS